MPRISEFYGIAASMYWNDHDPAHFHAIDGGDDALVKVEDGTVLAGALPQVARRLVGRWARLRWDDLRRDWQRA